MCQCRAESSAAVFETASNRRIAGVLSLVCQLVRQRRLSASAATLSRQTAVQPAWTDDDRVAALPDQRSETEPPRRRCREETSTFRVHASEQPTAAPQVGRATLPSRCQRDGERERRRRLVDERPLHRSGREEDRVHVDVVGLGVSEDGDDELAIRLDAAGRHEDTVRGLELIVLVHEAEHVVVEYRAAGGTKWVKLGATCAYSPPLPYVLGYPDVTIGFICTLTSAVPAGAEVRVTANVTIDGRATVYKVTKSRFV